MKLEISRSQSGRDGAVDFTLVCHLMLTPDEQAALARYGYPRALSDANRVLYGDLTGKSGYTLTHGSYIAVSKREQEIIEFCTDLLAEVKNRQAWGGSRSVDF